MLQASKRGSSPTVATRIAIIARVVEFAKKAAGTRQLRRLLRRVRKSELKPGASIFIVTATKQPDGTLQTRGTRALKPPDLAHRIRVLAVEQSEQYRKKWGLGFISSPGRTFRPSSAAILVVSVAPS